MKTQVSEVVTLFDKNSFVRRSLFRRLALNPVDGLRFYEFTGELTKLPIIGIFFKEYMRLYYKYIHSRSVKLPIEEIEKVIKNATHISVGPCPCRMIHEGNCDKPLYSCMKIDSFSEYVSALEKKETERGGERGNKYSKDLTTDEALAVVRNARKHGLILSLESCVSPYQNQICMCCTCCCVELRLREILGPAMGPYGPYVPEVDAGNCNGCGKCVKRCPYNTIEMKDEKAVINLDKCAHCGICAEACPNGSLSMRLYKNLIETYPEPGILKTIAVVAAVLQGHLLFIPFKMFNSQKHKYHEARPRKSDVAV